VERVCWVKSIATRLLEAWAPSLLTSTVSRHVYPLRLTSHYLGQEPKPANGLVTTESLPKSLVPRDSRIVLSLNMHGQRQHRLLERIYTGSPWPSMFTT
jgi:hypothetical protein